MKYSLLSKKPDSPAYCGVIYDLSADRAVNNLSDDKKRNEYFLSVLSSPLTDVENIRYRQEIFEDLSRCEGLFDALKLIFTRYDRIKTDWQDMKLGSISSSETNPEAFLRHSFASLKVTAIFPSTMASFFENIASTLGKYDIRSEALCDMKKRCDAMRGEEALGNIVEISQLFRYGEIEDYDFSLLVKADGLLYPEKADISAVSPVKKKQGGLAGLFKKDKKAENVITVGTAHSETGNDPQECSSYLLGCALADIDRKLTEITNNLYEIFYGLSNELMFYEIGLLYMDEAKKQGVPLCYPTILPAEDDVIRLKNVKELLLLSGGKGRETVPNDIDIGSSRAGMIIKGLTDSGKTVFLRAVAGAQLLAQSGLPVLAEEARLSVRGGFFSHFSSAEEDFLIGSAQGRFDQEAGEISRIIDNFRTHSLLLLNETFQTTSYEEGTESIYNILRYMPKLGAKYIFVTHLTRLFDYMHGENVMLASTSNDPATKYKIIIGESKN